MYTHIPIRLDLVIGSVELLALQTGVPSCRFLLATIKKNKHKMFLKVLYQT